MRDLRQSYPRWVAPMLGLTAGLSISIRYLVRDHGLGAWDSLLDLLREGDLKRMGTFLFTPVLGLGGGLIVLVLDPGQKPRAQDPASYAGSRANHAEPQTLLGRFLAIVSALLFIFPMLGLILGIAATWKNWRVRGWPRVVSRIALGLAIVPTGFGVYALLFRPQ